VDGSRQAAQNRAVTAHKFTDASMAILGLLLAFTFSMSLAKHSGIGASEPKRKSNFKLRDLLAMLPISFKFPTMHTGRILAVPPSKMA
jgi:hypothetical protein